MDIRENTKAAWLGEYARLTSGVLLMLVGVLLVNQVRRAGWL